MESLGSLSSIADIVVLDWHEQWRDLLSYTLHPYLLTCRTLQRQTVVLTQPAMSAAMWATSDGYVLKYFSG